MNLQKILRYTLLCGIFIIPFIPLLVAHNMFFPFITGKNFAFRIIVDLLAGVWAVLAYREASYRPKWSWIFAALTAFVGIIAIADFFGENPLKSIWSNFERMEGLVGLIHLFAYFLIIISVFKTEKLWERFFNVLLGVSVIMGIYGLFQLFGVLDINQGGVRVDSTFGNAAYLAVYNLFNIFIAAFMLLKQKREIWLRIAYCSVIALNLVILYFTETRGAILGLLAGVFVATALIAFLEKESVIIRKGAIGILAGVLLIIGGFFAVKNTSFVKENTVLSRFASISLKEKTTKSRFMVWNMAMNGFKDRPILGWGQENFNFVFNKYYDPGMYGQEQWFDRAHNVFFDWLIAGGILGLLAYLSLFASVLYLLWFGVDILSVVSKSILTGLFAAYFFHNIFVFDNLISYIMFFSLLGYIHNANTKIGKVELMFNKISARIKTVFSGGVMDIMIAPLVVVVVIFSLYFFNYKAIATNLTLLDGIKPHKEGLVKNLNLFKKALAYNSFGTQEVREQLPQVVFTVAGIKGVPQEIKNEFLKLADSELKAQIKAVPDDARGQLFYASFLDKFGRYDEAITYYKKALKLSPNKQAIYFGLVGAYLNKGENKKALEFAKTAFELEPEYMEARKNYAVTAIYNKEDKLAKDIIVSVFGNAIPDDDRFVRAYAITGQYDKLSEIWRYRVEKDPSNIQYRLSLAASYYDGGKKWKAIKEIEKAMDLSSDFKKQGEYLINEIRAGRKL
jgi:O-antigen ligase/Tfp pilus assembly protein PilF